MRYLDREVYESLGHSLVPGADFDQYEARAEQTVRRYTFHRISGADLAPPSDADDETKRIAQANQRGVAELMDLLYETDHPEAAPKGPLSGFSNEGYSESYATTTQQTLDQRTRAIIENYFTPDQRWRGF